MTNQAQDQCTEGRQTRLSKSRIIAGLQCERRIWLEAYRRDEVDVDSSSQSRLDTGHEVGEIAQKLFAPGVLIGHVDRLHLALAETTELIAAKDGTTVFEAAFQHDGVLVRADVLQSAGLQYDLIEVKASTSVKDYQLDDCAVQAWVIESAGVSLRKIKLAHINNQFVFQGEGDYSGLMVAEDVTDAVRERLAKVPAWIDRSRRALQGVEPLVKTGGQCHKPFKCPFQKYCRAQEPAEPDFPITILPHASKLITALQGEGYTDLCKVPSSRLVKPLHQRIRDASINGCSILDEQARTVVRALPYPRFYLDFETVDFAVPRWVGTRPYQQIPFQWSCHVDRCREPIEHHSFLSLSGEIPIRSFAESLLTMLGEAGPILVYNASFEKGRIRDLATMFPDLSPRLEALEPRVVDLLPIAREHYYHPAMKGSWSIKKVIPTIDLELSYDQFGTVASSGDAPLAYREAIDPKTSPERRKELGDALHRYCANDTLAMVRIVEAFGQ